VQGLGQAVKVYFTGFTGFPIFSDYSLCNSNVTVDEDDEGLDLLP
jgi:hypothetical protein